MRRLLGPILSSFVLAACEETGAGDEQADSSTGPMDTTPHAVLLAPVSDTVCETLVVGVQVQALQVGCEHPPPAPCTMPSDPEPILGDMVSCPLTDDVTLGVRIELAAEYQVSVVADRSPEDPTTECFAENAMQTSVRVTSVDLDVQAQKMLVALGSACPPE